MKKDDIQNIQGAEHLKYDGLLNLAHERGLKRITTVLIQIPTPENNGVCIMHATVEMEDGTTFDGIGDASPQNVGRMIAPHLIRMAETRAKGRALRDAVNVGQAIEEEFGETDNVRHLEPRRSAQPQQSNTRRVDTDTGEVLEANPFAGEPVHDQNQDPSPTVALAQAELKKARSAYAAFHHVDDKAAMKAALNAITSVPPDYADWTVQHYTSLTIWLNSNRQPERTPEPNKYEPVEV